MPKLVFETEEQMQKALVGCKFADIPCKTEYEENLACYLLNEIETEGE